MTMIYPVGWFPPLIKLLCLSISLKYTLVTDNVILLDALDKSHEMDKEVSCRGISTLGLLASLKAPNIANGKTGRKLLHGF